jgi:hypothetical protein
VAAGQGCGTWPPARAATEVVEQLDQPRELRGRRMVDRGELVSCGRHGARLAAFVCRHLVESLRTGWRVGCHTPNGAANDDQSWCDACERGRGREGEWNDRAEAYVDIRLLCLGCLPGPGS